MNSLDLSLVIETVAVILIVLFVHELGHVIVARSCGVRVAQLHIGLGPEIFGITDRHGTRWSLALLPIAGWTKYIECGQTAANGTDENIRHESAILISRKAAIYFAGAMSNFLFAAILLLGAYIIYGEEAFFEGATSINVAFVAIAATLSVSVGLFNLLPVPPLDGWLLFCTAIEFLTGRPLSERLQGKLSLIGLSAITVTSVFFAILVVARWQ
jgi:membrane-associated protease RseP (regulator of RpoE activity)